MSETIAIFSTALICGAWIALAKVCAFRMGQKDEELENLMKQNEEYKKLITAQPEPPKYSEVDTI